MSKKEQFAYWAGIIDGEGCIQLNKRIDKRYNSVEYYLRVRIAMTVAKELLEGLKKQWGGSIYIRYPKNKKHKDQCEWQLIGLKSEYFLKAILPYVFIKKAQIENALEFRAKTYPLGSEKWRKIPGEILKKREEYYQKGKVLMRMG